VFGQLAVLEAHDIHHDPVRRLADVAKPAVEQDVIAIGDGEPVLVAEIFGDPLDQGEEPLASGRNVGGVLNVARRPETLCGRVVPLVEKGLEGLQHEGFVLFLDRLRHLILLRCARGAVFRPVELTQPRLTMSTDIVFSASIFASRQELCGPGFRPCGQLGRTCFVKGASSAVVRPFRGDRN
jgi:hypothetical protein